MSFSRLFMTKAKARQCAALPLLWTSEGKLTIGLVTTRETHRWILPKGWVEHSISPSQTAATEAREEAGLIGRVASKPLASYTYRKRLHLLASVVCQVDVFELLVTQRLDDWPERGQREIAFVEPAVAADRVSDSGLADILRAIGNGSLVLASAGVGGQKHV